MSTSTSRAPGPSSRRRRPGPAPGSVPGSRMPRAERQEQLLAIAERVFAEQGYQLTTMEKVAERAGITKPVIYDYFGSKEGLLSACVARARAQLRASTVAAWDDVPAGATLEDYLSVGVRAFFDFIDEHASAFTLIQHEGALQASARRGLESIREQQSAVMVDTLAGVPEARDVPRVLVEGFAEVLIGACERVAVWRLKRPGVSAEQATAIVTTVVWSGLGSITGPGRS